MKGLIAEAARVRVGVVDDHAITRRALREFLGSHDFIDVVGEASDGREALDLARRCPMDVLLLDIEMPGQNGMEALRHILAPRRAPAVIMLSSHPPATYGVEVIRRGAAGYLNKQCEPEEILQAVRVVADGRRYLGEDVVSLMAESAISGEAEPRHRTLTEREFQVFLRFAQGQSRQQAARDLSLTVSTITAHRMKIMEKMGARSVSDLTYYAVKHGLIA